MSSLANTQPIVQPTTTYSQQVMGTNANATAQGEDNTMQDGINQDNIYNTLFSRLFVKLRENSYKGSKSDQK